MSAASIAHTWKMSKTWIVQISTTLQMALRTLPTFFMLMWHLFLSSGAVEPNEYSQPCVQWQSAQLE
jgi:hypothetical protein